MRSWPLLCRPRHSDLPQVLVHLAQEHRRDLVERQVGSLPLPVVLLLRRVPEEQLAERDRLVALPRRVAGVAQDRLQAERTERLLERIPSCDRAADIPEPGGRVKKKCRFGQVFSTVEVRVAGAKGRRIARTGLASKPTSLSGSAINS